MQTDLKTIKIVLLFLGGILVIYLIYLLSSLLIPLAMALFLAILLQPVLAWFERKKWPFALSLSAISVSSLTFLALFGILIYQTGVSLVEEKDKLLGQINIKLDSLFAWFNSFGLVELNSVEITKILGQMMSSDWILKSSGMFAGMVGSFTGTFFMTALYLIAFLGGILKYEQYIHYLEEGSPEKESQMLQGFTQVKNSIVTYIKIKFFMSLGTGIGFAMVCWIFGLDFAIFWGFLAFILNFIPTVGSIIATIPPILLALVQIEAMEMILLMILILIIIQIMAGNIIEPRLMGSSLALNTITVILGLVFWGYLWGVTGMILSVPLLVLTKVILTQIPEAQILVRLMGGSSGSK